MLRHRSRQFLDRGDRPTQSTSQPPSRAPSPVRQSRLGLRGGQRADRLQDVAGRAHRAGDRPPAGRRRPATCRAIRCAGEVQLADPSYRVVQQQPGARLPAEGVGSGRCRCRPRRSRDGPTRTRSGWSTFHSSGQSPVSSPRANRLVPIAPSANSTGLSVSSRASRSDIGLKAPERRERAEAPQDNATAGKSVAEARGPPPPARRRLSPVRRPRPARGAFVGLPSAAGAPKSLP